MANSNIARGEKLTLHLVSWGRLGEAMAYHEDRDVFVFGGIPGEKVVAEVVRTRRKYVAARVVEVLEPSPQRVDPPCDYFGDCTGCQWQHVDYAAQLSAKQEKVVDALFRVGHFSDPPVSSVVPSTLQYGYRNHARFTVGPGGILGFVNRETRQFVGIDHCQIMHQEINRNLTLLQGNCEETTQLSIRAGIKSGDFLVQPMMTSPGVPIPTGQQSYTDSVGGKSFRVSSPSFFQVNVDQAAETVQVVRRCLDLSPDDVLLDAYTGVGTFAILLAPYVKKVIAVEESAAAVADAKDNASGLDNIEFTRGENRGGARPADRKARRGGAGPTPSRLPAGGAGEPDPVGAVPGRLCVMRRGDPGQGLEDPLRCSLHPQAGRSIGHVSADAPRRVCGGPRPVWTVFEGHSCFRVSQAEGVVIGPGIRVSGDAC